MYVSISSVMKISRGKNIRKAYEEFLVGNEFRKNWKVQTNDSWIITTLTYMIVYLVHEY